MQRFDVEMHNWKRGFGGKIVLPMDENFIRQYLKALQRMEQQSVKARLIEFLRLCVLWRRMIFWVRIINTANI